MLSPFLATNYEGIEQILFVPVMVLTFLVGLLAMVDRVRWLAWSCAVVCAGASLFALSYAYSSYATRDDVAQQNKYWGYGALSVAAIFALTPKRKPHRDK